MSYVPNEPKNLGTDVVKMECPKVLCVALSIARVIKSTHAVMQLCLLVFDTFLRNS